MTQNLANLISHLGGGRKTIIWTWSLIFLPGTIVHELSHFLAATFTGLRTGKIQVFPEFIEEIEDHHNKSDKVSLGFVQVQQPNPIQGFIVGVAPFITGTIMMVWLVSLLHSSIEGGSVQQILLQAYFFFTIANSFFPSWTDLKQALPLIYILTAGGIAFWLLDIQITVGNPSLLVDLLDTLNISLLISVAINIMILCLLFPLNQLAKPKRRH